MWDHGRMGEKRKKDRSKRRCLCLTPRHPTHRKQDQHSPELLSWSSHIQRSSFLWDNTSGKLTDFNTYFLFVIDSQESNVFADGLTFFLVPNGSTPNITTGGAIGPPIGSSPTFSATTPFVAVEFDTFHNGWDPVNITPITHVGININSLNSSAYAIWNSDVIHGSENEAWISYNSSSQNLSVILRTGSVNNSNSAESSISFVVDLKTKLPEWVTIGFSAATGLFF
ncbi:hypothetical protein ACSBR2_021884 [Camellia fascicularis]